MIGSHEQTQQGQQGQQGMQELLSALTRFTQQFEYQPNLQSPILQISQALKTLQTETNAQLPNAPSGERNLSPVLRRRRRLSPMSHGFKKTLHVNIYILIKFTFKFNLGN